MFTQLNPSTEKMIPEKIFESGHPEIKVNSSVDLPPGKIYLETETPGKNQNQGTPWIFTSIPTPVIIKNRTAQFCGVLGG